MKKNLLLFFVLFMTLLGSCQKNSYTIILDYNGLSGDIEKIEIVNGENLPRLPKPCNEFNKFEGWYATKNGIEFQVTDGNYILVDNGKFKAKNYDIIDNTITFTAKYSYNEINCFVEIDYNNSLNNKVLNITYGDKISKLSAISKSYSKFLGYYTMYNGKEVMVHNGTNFINGYDTLDELHYNISNYTVKIYAKFLEEDITILLQADSNEFNDQTIIAKYDSTLDSLPIPEKANHTFDYWYYDNNGEEIIVYNLRGFVSNKKILNENNYKIKNGQIILKAKFSISMKTVLLKLGNSDDANSISIKVPYGDDITEYVEDIRIGGKVVTKWSTKMNDINFENIFVGPVTEDNIVLYPAENNAYLLTLISDVTKKIYVSENQIVSLDNLSKNGYLFLGWMDNDNILHKNSYCVTKENVLVAKWLNVDKKTINVRKNGFSSPYIYTPKSVDKKPTLREWEDVVMFNDIFEMDLLKENGYNGFTLTYSCDVNVIDDGYQHIYVYSSHEISDYYLLYSKKYDYSEGKTTATFSVNIPFNKLVNNYISIRYAASGYFSELLYSHGNQWNCSNVVVTLTPYK